MNRNKAVLGRLAAVSAFIYNLLFGNLFTIHGTVQMKRLNHPLNNIGSHS